MSNHAMVRAYATARHVPLPQNDLQTFEHHEAVGGFQRHDKLLHLQDGGGISPYVDSPTASHHRRVVAERSTGQRPDFCSDEACYNDQNAPT